MAARRTVAAAPRSSGKSAQPLGNAGLNPRNAVTTDSAAQRAIHDAGAQTRRTLRWRSPHTTANSFLSNLETIRGRSRAAVRNDGYAKSIIDKLVTNIIGTGMIPMPQVADAELKLRISETWLDWTDESDADGLLDFYGQESQVCRAWLEAGEVFVRMRPREAKDGLTVPLQLQVLEAEMCPHTYEAVLPSGNRVRAGIEFDLIGRRIAYWFHPSRPGDPQDYDPNDLRRVPAEFVIHIFDPLRPGQLRGLPVLTSALARLWLLDKFDDAMLTRHELANLFAGFIKSSPNAGDTDINPLTGTAVETDADDKSLVSLEPGLIQQLDPDTDVTFSDPPQPAQTYPDFMRQQLIGACAAAGAPYEVVTGDMSKVNDRTVRVILNEFRRRIQAWQHQVIGFQFCRRVWTTWMDRAFLAASLPIPVDYIETPTKYARVKWQPQGWAYIQPVQDVQAKKDAIRAGLSTRKDEAAEMGEDAELIDQQNAIDNKRADDLGLVYDSDPRKVSNAGLTQARQPGSEIPGEGANP